VPYAELRFLVAPDVDDQPPCRPNNFAAGPGCGHLNFVTVEALRLISSRRLPRRFHPIYRKRVLLIHPYWICALLRVHAMAAVAHHCSSRPLHPPIWPTRRGGDRLSGVQPSPSENPALQNRDLSRRLPKKKRLSRATHCRRRTGNSSTTPSSASHMTARRSAVIPGRPSRSPHRTGCRTYFMGEY